MKNCNAVILLGGVPAGESPCLLTLPATGTGYVTAAPLHDASRRYAVTRRLRFTDGRPDSAADGLTIFDWDRGLFELELWCGALAPDPDPAFPYTLTQRPYEGMNAVLYYENGLWVSLESNRRLLSGFAMGDAREGELVVMGRLLVAIAHGEKDLARILAPDRSQLAVLAADSIRVENGELVVLERLRTQRGHERRTAYRAEGLQLVPAAPQIGFFSAPAQVPASLPLACCEAVLHGLYAEALELMDADLRAALDPDAVREFFGDFAAVRPFLADSGVAGLVLAPENGVFPVRRLGFDLDNDHITNISEDA